MAAMAGLLNHSLTAGQALTGTGANPMAAAPAAEGAESTSASSDNSSSTISANDFLTLLVTEMQNQDPTADTDPNEYINQLVQVNSLEQLISINQNLQTVLGTASSSSNGAQTGTGQAGDLPAAVSASSVTGAGAAGKAAPGVAPAHRTGALAAGPSPGGSAAPGPGAAQGIGRFAQSAGARRAPGNLGVPAAQAAAHKVAHALDGHPHAPTAPGRLSGAQ